MTRLKLFALAGFAAVGTAFLFAGCGGGAGPIVQDIPDFFAPSIATPSQSPSPAVEGSDLVITSDILDNKGAVTAQLLFRKIGTSAFTAVAGTKAGDKFTFTIPGASVVTPGIEYYLSASDGANGSTVPAGAPGALVTIPLNFVSVSHSALPGAKAGSDVTIQATITSDAALNLANDGSGNPLTGFYWRTVGAPAFTAGAFTKSGDTFSGTIPGAQVAAGDYEYYIQAENVKGARSYFPSAAPGTTLRFTASVGFNNPPIASISVLTPTPAVGVDVTLQGNFADSDGPGPYSFRWTTTAASNIVALSNATGAITTFQATAPGNYAFTLIVNDGKIDSAPNTVNIQVSSPTITGPLAAGETVLYRAASPYIVTSDVTVGAGSILKIERGVTVKFDSNTAIVVNGGTLGADGDATNKITFTANTPLQIKGFWRGIFLQNTPRFPQSSINFCTVTLSKEGIVLLNADSPTISANTFTLNSNQGVYADNSSTTITKNTFTDNGTDGVVCVNNSTVTISDNVINKNKRNGVLCDRSRAEIARNTISENNYGIFVSNCAGGQVVNVTGNRVSLNTDGLRFIDNNTKITVINNRIFTNNDNGIAIQNAPAFVNAQGPTIIGNAIHNNRDDGIHVENCYGTVDPSVARPAADTLDIESNVISFSGAEGIECMNASPWINHCVIGTAADNGVLCIGAGARPLIKNSIITLSSRAAVAIKNDAAGGKPLPRIWWNDMVANPQGFIDLDDLANSPTLNFVGVPNIGTVAVALGGTTAGTVSVNPANNPTTVGLTIGGAVGANALVGGAAVVIVSGNQYQVSIATDGAGAPTTATVTAAGVTAGPTAFVGTSAAMNIPRVTTRTVPTQGGVGYVNSLTGAQTGQNVGVNPMIESLAFPTNYPWEDPFSIAWRLQSDPPANPQEHARNGIYFPGGYKLAGADQVVGNADSLAINSGEAVSVDPATGFTLQNDDIGLRSWNPPIFPTL